MAKMFPVTSSNVESLGYDDATRELHVRFKGGGHYVYADVPSGSFENVLAAKSIGAAIHSIKAKHKARKL